jgi:hypothetical protein
MTMLPREGRSRRPSRPRVSAPFATLAAFALAVVWCGGARGAEGTGAAVVLEDPAGDDTGPGTYVYPGVEGFRKGAFDLREVRLRPVAGGVEIRVVTGVAPEPVRIRTGVAERTRAVTLPVFDLYVIDGDRKAGRGQTALLPGRRVSPGDPRGWDRAVVLSDVPDALETHYRRAAPDRVDSVCFPRSVVRSGRTLTARVPRSCLPMDLSRAGYLVVVTALGPGGGFQGMVRRSSDDARADDPDAWVRSVDPVVGNCNVWEDGLGASPCALGGCEPCGSHPFVLDAIVPAGADQQALLKAYDPKTRRLAVLPFVWPGGGPAPGAGAPDGAAPGGGTAAAPADPRLPVTTVRDQQVTVRLPEGADGAGWPAGTLGALVCPGDRPGGTVVVRGAAAGFLVLDRVPDGHPVCEGASVLF